MFTEHWTKLPYFVRSGSITGQYVKVLSSYEETLDKYEPFCPVSYMAPSLPVHFALAKCSFMIFSMNLPRKFSFDKLFYQFEFKTSRYFKF